MVDFVYFDLDDTLLDHRSAERQALRDLASAYPGLRHLDPILVEQTYHDVNIRVWSDYGAGLIDKAATKSDRFAGIFEAFDIDADPVQAGDAYLEAYADHWAYLPGARAAFDRIADVLPVGILTNGFSEIQQAKLRQFPELKERSRCVIISEEFGALKPDPSLFAHAAEQSGERPSRILYVGDSFRSDVQGGLGAGWQVAWLNGDLAAVPDGVFVFSEWSELLDRLELAV